MKKAIAMLAFVIAGQLSTAHATTDGIKTLQTDELTPLNSDKMTLEASADHGTGLHPTLTDDPDKFQAAIGDETVLTHADFSSVAGRTVPLFVKSTEGNNLAVGIYGSLQKPGQISTTQAVTSYQGLPAVYWFGDQAESTFVLANGSVQIVFPQDVDAASLMIDTSTYPQKLLPDDDRSIPTLLLDAEGLLVGQGSITVKSITTSPNFFGIVSAIPFRSIIISNTAETWMFSDLNYATDQEHPMMDSVKHPNTHEVKPCTMNDGTCAAERDN